MPANLVLPSPARPAVLMSPFWWSCGAVAIGLAWLLPNHYAPWTTFHLDAWMAFVLLLVSGWVLLRTRPAAGWSAMSLLLLLLVAMPGLQHAAGLVVSAGTAWINTAYLLGLWLAWVTGAQWEAAAPDQLPDGLFAAIGLAGFVSVGLALYQGLQLDGLDVWALGGGATRAIANLGQPNQLGTLFVWGLLAVGWGHVRGRIGGPVAVAAAAFLLLGTAMTGSRTAWVSITILGGAGWVWRRHWPHPRLPRVLAGLGAFFVVCVLSVGPALRWALGEVGNDVADIVRISGEARPTVWALFLDASTHRPWFGYGWGQVTPAFLDAALDHPPLRAYFSHSHNLFLDLVLWCGWPLGLLLSVCLLAWLMRRLWRVRSARDALLVLLILVVANHAMLELPLHHAYFLLPVGLVAGVLDVRMPIRPVLQARRWMRPVVLASWLAAAALLAGIVRDYMRVETAYQGLRFEWANIKTPPVEPPDVLLLTQWHDMVRMVKWDLRQPASDADLRWMEHVLGLHPNIGLFQIYAMALAQQGHPQQAARWMRTMCVSMADAKCAQVAAFWRFRARTDAALAAVPWPPPVQGAAP